MLFNPCQKCTLWNSDPPTSVIFLPFLYLVVLKFNDKTWVKRKWGQFIKINKTHQFTGDKRETSPAGVMKKAVGKIGQLRSMQIPRMVFNGLSLSRLTLEQHFSTFPHSLSPIPGVFSFWEDQHRKHLYFSLPNFHVLKSIFSVYFLLLITLRHRYTISVSVSALYVSVLHI